MKKKSKDEYIVLYQGVKLSKQEANRVGLSIILGIIGAVIFFLLLGPGYKLLSLIFCFSLSAIGYFWIGKKIFKI